MPEDEIVFSLRLPSNLYARLRALAALDERSINAEILVAIRALIADYERKNGAIVVEDR